MERRSSAFNLLCLGISALIASLFFIPFSVWAQVTDINSKMLLTNTVVKEGRFKPLTSIDELPIIARNWHDQQSRKIRWYKLELNTQLVEPMSDGSVIAYKVQQDPILKIKINEFIKDQATFYLFATHPKVDFEQLIQNEKNSETRQPVLDAYGKVLTAKNIKTEQFFTNVNFEMEIPRLQLVVNDPKKEKTVEVTIDQSVLYLALPDIRKDENDLMMPPEFKLQFNEQITSEEKATRNAGTIKAFKISYKSVEDEKKMALFFRELKIMNEVCPMNMPPKAEFFSGLVTVVHNYKPLDLKKQFKSEGLQNAKLTICGYLQDKGTPFREGVTFEFRIDPKDRSEIVQVETKKFRRHANGSWKYVDEKLEAVQKNFKYDQDQLKEATSKKAPKAVITDLQEKLKVTRAELSELKMISLEEQWMDLYFVALKDAVLYYDLSGTVGFVKVVSKKE